MEAVNGSLEAWKLGSLDGSPSKPLNIQTSQHPSEPIRLLEIERELTGPDRDTAFARYDAILANLDHRLSAALREGLSPDDFPRVEALKEANALARKILRLTVRVDGQAQHQNG